MSVGLEIWIAAFYYESSTEPVITHSGGVRGATRVWERRNSISGFLADY